MEANRQLDMKKLQERKTELTQLGLALDVVTAETTIGFSFQDNAV